MSRLLPCLGFLAVLAAVGPLSGASRDVLVYADLTADGRKVTPPTAAQPAYYFLLAGGYRQEGETVAGETSPPALQVAQLVARELARRHYLLVGKSTPAPSLLIVFHWGYMNPEKADLGDPGDSQEVFFNEREMLALVAGDSAGNLMPGSIARSEIMQAAEDDRYFVLVSAFDFAAATHRRKILLWRARMSVPSNGVTLAAVLPLLVRSGGPFFGRETDLPRHVRGDAVPDGRVEIGTPTVVDGPAAAPAKK